MAASISTTSKKVSTSYIHDDIAFSILSKLPIKSLTRFTCVQKSWSLLFQDHHHFLKKFRTNFFKYHDDIDGNMHILIKETNEEYPYHFSLYVLGGGRYEDRVILNWPPVFEEDEYGNICVEIVGSNSVNGILCLYDGFDNDTIIVLWNPITRRFKKIPPSHYPYASIEFNLYPEAFGYDRVRDDYKVIREARYPLDFEGNWIYLPNKDHSFWKTVVDELDMYDHYWEEAEMIVELEDPFCEIYSLKSNSWRKLDGVNMVYFPGSCNVNLNEMSHWLSVKGNCMVSFDFSNEIFFETTLPSTSWVVAALADLVMLNGSVSLVSNNNRTEYFIIWTLGELGVKESWTKLFVVGPLTCDMRPMGAGRSYIFLSKNDNELALYDWSTHSIIEFEFKGDFLLQIVIL